MESFLEFFEPLTRLLSTVIGIILFFIFVVRPLLNYLMLNHEIEHLKKRQAEMMTAEFAGESAEGHDDEIAAEEYVPGRRASTQDALGRLAASDPEKAGELVKKWINND
jgi:flagellar biosynthesis/type III secretory pathway M-ring protein FliF/YscJ